MGGGFSQAGATCILFVAQLSAGDFFLGLRIKETSSGPEYWSGPQRVTKFPPELTVNVLAYLGTCGRPETADLRSAKTELQALRWTAAWKTGMKLRPVKGLDVVQAESSLDDELEKRTGIPSPPPLSSGAPRTAWKVTLHLHEGDAALTDSLIVTASTKDGTQVTRFAAHL
jgi:hypothetical protein